jgi:ribosomal protein S20
MGINYGPNDSDDAFWVEFDLRMEISRRGLKDKASDKLRRIQKSLDLAIELEDKEVAEAGDKLEECEIGSGANLNNRLMRSEAETEMKSPEEALEDLEKQIEEAFKEIDEFVESDVERRENEDDKDWREFLSVRRAKHLKEVYGEHDVLGMIAQWFKK